MEKTAASLIASSNTSLQPVAQRHQLVDSGDDTALFGKGWHRNKKCLYTGPHANVGPWHRLLVLDAVHQLRIAQGIDHEV